MPGFITRGRKNLKKKMIFLMGNKGNVIEKKKAAVEVIEREYSWEKITDEYERLFLNLAER